VADKEATMRALESISKGARKARSSKIDPRERTALLISIGLAEPEDEDESEEDDDESDADS